MGFDLSSDMPALLGYPVFCSGNNQQMTMWSLAINKRSFFSDICANTTPFFRVGLGEVAQGQYTICVSILSHLPDGDNAAVESQLLLLKRYSVHLARVEQNLPLCPKGAMLGQKHRQPVDKK